MLYSYRIRLLYVVDGDTLYGQLDRGHKQYDEGYVRLKDVWCPELDDPGGMEAAAFTHGWCIDNVRVQDRQWAFAGHEARPWLLLRSTRDQRDPYGRWLGVVAQLNARMDDMEPGTVSLNDALLQSPHAMRTVAGVDPWAKPIPLVAWHARSSGKGAGRSSTSTSSRPG